MPARPPARLLWLLVLGPVLTLLLFPHPPYTNTEAWRWYYDVVGNARCPIMDTWWQTETGAHMITPLMGTTTLKPGSATLPFFGVEPCICDEKGNELQVRGEQGLSRLG